MSWNPAARWDAFWRITGIALVLVIELSLTWLYWEELRGKHESLSTTVRNMGLVIGGSIAILFAVWRGIVAEKQAKTAQRGLLNERYQKGAEMLGSEKLSVRLGGIYALARLAHEHPGDYHTQIMSLLCAFVRNQPVVEQKTQDTKKLREDVQAAMTAIGDRSEAQIKIEEKEGYRMNLNEVDLRSGNLRSANLTRVDLWKANLRSADLDEANLTEVDLRVADLNGVNLTGATLTRANLSMAQVTGWASISEANLTGARLFGTDLHNALLSGADLGKAFLRDCKGLTQEKLDRAVARKDAPPDLTGAVDAKTGKPLVWCERSITE